PTLRVTSVMRNALPATTVRGGADTRTTLTGSGALGDASVPAAPTTAATQTRSAMTPCLLVRLRLVCRSMEFRGVIPAITTPFTDELELDLSSLTTNIERLRAAGIEIFCACGTMGEASALKLEE